MCATGLVLLACKGELMVEKRCPRDRALELVEGGMVSADHLLLCCLKAMSSDDVDWMLDANELSERFLEEEEEVKP